MLKIFLGKTLGQKWGIKNALSRTASFIILPACPKESILIISVPLPRVYHCYPLVTARNYFLSSMSLRNCSSDMDNLAAASEIVRIPSQTSCTKVSLLSTLLSAFKTTFIALLAEQLLHYSSHSSHSLLVLFQISFLFRISVQRFHLRYENLVR